MKIRLGWSVLMLGLAMGAYNADQKQPLKKPLPTPATTSEIGLMFPHTYNISPEQRQAKNPIRFTELSVERGKKLFLNHCAMCHGNNADGKGDLVTVLDVHPPDFNKTAVLGKRTDGELFVIIGQGSEKMPSHYTRLDEKQMWDIVNFLRMVEGRIPAKPTEQDKEGNETASVSFLPVR